MTKKLAIIGRGTAGCYAVTHFAKHTDWEIDWIYDPNINPQAVGEGSQADFPEDLSRNCDFNILELESIYGTFKAGVYKKNWTDNTFIHRFPPGKVGYHFTATKLQEWVINYATSIKKINIVHKNITDYADLDSSYVMDCSGKPKNFDSFNLSEYIPVNAVHVVQCFWEGVRFEYTKAIARPYGWVFLIPLLNRCSVGYLYNKDINSLDDVCVDILECISEEGLVPSDTTNSFNFNNYYRKVNYLDRICYNGNASFFLEPLEATSINFMNNIQRKAYDYWNGNKTLDICNLEYQNSIKEIENMIMLHYYTGSIFNTEFWYKAKHKAHINLKTLKENIVFRMLMNRMIDQDFGCWQYDSWMQNIKGLKININDIL
jgi:tryptophan halogenase